MRELFPSDGISVQSDQSAAEFFIAGTHPNGENDEHYIYSVKWTPNMLTIKAVNSEYEPSKDITDDKELTNGQGFIIIRDFAGNINNTHLQLDCLNNGLAYTYGTLHGMIGATHL